MKKLFLIFLTSVLSGAVAVADCVLVPLSLKERVDAATLIIEAQVAEKNAYWNAGKTMIFTSNRLVISKVYKGSEYISGKQIDLITSGGRVGDKAVRVDPELETETGEIGIFMLVLKNGEWVSESGPQGYLKIDKHTAICTDVFNTYPAYSIQNTLKMLTGLEVIDINALLTKVILTSKRAAPVISSISPKTITSGTSSVLTIKGSNFNAVQDTSSVQFRNGDDGGISFIKALKRDYISWSDTMIRLIVRTKAGTGRIRVVATGNGVVTSADTLKVSYAHLNVVSGDSIGYETQQIGMNLNNGITWKMNRRFFDSSGARGAFIRSLERWRCGTYINWDTLGTLNHSAIKSDGVNMCAWDSSGAMPSGVLAQCFSYWSGCFNPGLKWYVNELDIRFRVKPTGSTNWNYTTGNATASQFHFESVATHELGHGHQMGHVINSAVVMHYSIANGQTKPGLSADDISAGNYVINKSGSSVCGKNGHSKLNSGNCAIVAPNAGFTMSKQIVCKNETVTYTDSSSGNISSWSWNFGSDASPATANTKGPHNVIYSNGGSKTVSLTITTITGNLNKTKNLTVRNDSKMTVDFNYTAAGKGMVSFSNLSNNPTGSIWYFGDGDSSLLQTPVHQYSSGGTYNVKLVASNTCNTEVSTKAVKFSLMNFGVSKDTACIAEQITYTDSSDNLAASWSWVFNGGSPANAVGKGPHNVSYNSPGNKSAQLTVTVSGAPSQTYTISNLLHIGTDTASKAEFIYGYYGKNIVGFDNRSSGSNKSYKWYFGDGDSSTEMNPVHTYQNASNKTVRLVVQGDCGTDDTIVLLRDFTRLELTADEIFEVYPNPAGDRLFFKVTSGDFRIQICDMSGKLISLLPDNVNSTDISSLPAGCYIIRLESSSGINAYKLIVKY